MSRYIDADKLEYITWSLYNGHDMKGNTLFVEREIVSKQIVDAMPTADVANIVRCKYCQHSEYDDYHGNYYCRKLRSWCNGEFYCAYGEEE